MNEEQVSAVYRHLTHLEHYLSLQLGTSETDSVQALSAYDNHPADLATDTFERELDLGIEIGLQNRLNWVARAVEKLQQGTYGICEECGQPIDPGRLQAMPEAIFCIQCQSEEEISYRPIASESQVIPIQRLETPDYDAVEADSEDFWQSVAEWGNSDSPQDTPPAVDYNETFIGFAEPIGYVEEVESIVDADGEALLDSVREKLRRQGKSIDKESDEYPE
ncbi:MAG: TraR/DksA C4-type zinc finger protein [Sulfobacillus sp.]